MIDKNPVLSVVDGKMCINGKTFEHTELRESKEYLQTNWAARIYYCRCGIFFNRSTVSFVLGLR